MNDRRPPLVSLCLLVAFVVGACLPNAIAPTGSAGLRTPAVPTRSPGPSGPTPRPSFVAPTATPMPSFHTYVVVRGDSLISIADRFGTTARSIAYWNRAAHPSLDPESEAYSPNRIEIGWTLALIPNAILDPQTLPEQTPLPAASASIPTAAPDGSPAVTPAPGAGAVAVSHGWRDGHEVALTFDMGGRLDPAVDILTWLTDHGVHATIFPTGKATAETAIGQLAVGRAGARPDLFDIGNHSWDHPTFTDLDAATIADQLRRTESAVAERGGTTTKPWFRPPFGAWDQDVRKAVGDIGVQGVTVTEVKGFGRQRGHTEIYRGAEYAVEFVPKAKVEIAVPDALLDQVVEAIIQAARTGKVGDGKIFVVDLEQVVRIRTGEHDESAI